MVRWCIKDDDSCEVSELTDIIWRGPAAWEPTKTSVKCLMFVDLSMKPKGLQKETTTCIEDLWSVKQHQTCRNDEGHTPFTGYKDILAIAYVFLQLKSINCFALMK